MDNELKGKLEQMDSATTKEELTEAYTCIVGILGEHYKSRLNEINAVKQEEEKTETQSGESEQNGLCEDQSITQEITQEVTQDDSDVEERNASDQEDIQETEQSSDVKDDSPVYAVFYSLNNAAYVAIDERMRACVPVRNIAKAYYTTADANGIMNGQNELSRYNLDKLKPIQIKFLTQKEYDDTIGRAKEMEKLMANMPTVKDNGKIDLDKKVQNFASGNSSGAGATHIGSTNKSNSSYHDDYSGDRRYSAYYYSGNYHHSFGNPYSQYYETDESENADYYNGTSGESPSITYPVAPLRDRMENPRLLYIAMHNGIDDEDVFCPRSFDNDIPKIDRYNYCDIDDYSVLIPLLNETINKIAGTKSGWLAHVYMSTDMEINVDYMMDIDYSVLDDAIHAWKRKNKGMELMYVEEFDPTIVHFKRNIKYLVKTGKCTDDDRYQMMAYAIYNYARCILAYEEYVRENRLTN